jgi:MFS family permease
MSAARPSPYREWAVLLVASLATFLNTVDISILNVAMPVIERDLGVEMRLLQWLQGIYGLSCAGFLLLSGRLADLIGRRCVFLTGVALFGAASLGGSVAPGFAVLLAARAIQGIGAALMVPSAISIISTTFEEALAETGRWEFFRPSPLRASRLASSRVR